MHQNILQMKLCMDLISNTFLEIKLRMDLSPVTLYTSCPSVAALNLRITLPLSPIFIPLCNSHIQSLKLNYLSWISICAFQATTSALPSTTRPLIHTATSTIIHHIPATAKRAFHTASLYAFDASVLTKPTF